MDGWMDGCMDGNTARTFSSQVNTPIWLLQRAICAQVVLDELCPGHAKGFCACSASVSTTLGFFLGISRSSVPLVADVEECGVEHTQRFASSSAFVCARKGGGCNRRSKQLSHKQLWQNGCNRLASWLFHCSLNLCA